MAACGDDPSPGVAVLDGGRPLDGSLHDGSATDAHADVDAADAGAQEKTCYLRSGAEVVAERAFDPQTRLAVAFHARGAQLSWSQLAGGRSRAFSRWFSVEAGAVDAPPSDGDSTQRDVHTSPLRTGFLTTWSEGSGGRFGLRARRSDDQGAPLDGTPVALTGTDVNHRDAVSAQGADGNILIAFVDGDAQRGQTRLLGADAKPIADARELAGFGAILGRPALAPFGAGYLLAWVDAQAKRVHLQKLDAAGVPSAASELIDSEGDARGNLDLATIADGGALAWDVLVAGVRPEVRVRTIDQDAAPNAIEEKVTRFPDTGLHPALAAVRGGYLVAYRSAQGSTTSLRVQMLDGRGQPLPSSNAALTVAPLYQQDLSLAMRLGNDGQDAFVGWLDQIPDTADYQLQRAWISCD